MLTSRDHFCHASASLGMCRNSVALRYRHALASRPTRGWGHVALGTAEELTSADPTLSTYREPALRRLEAVLLIAREPLSSRRLAKLARLEDGTRARSLTKRLRQMYDLAGTAFQVEEVAGGFQLLTRPPFARWLARMHCVKSELRLSEPAMETLAVVAYRQPVMRAEIESIRGVQSGDLLRQMMDRELVRIVGRADELGRPFLYGTTSHFLRLFGFSNISQLPRAAELKAAEVVFETEVAKPASGTDDGPSAGRLTSPGEEDSPVTDSSSSQMETELDVRAEEPDEDYGYEEQIEDDDIEEDDFDGDDDDGDDGDGDGDDGDDDDDDDGYDDEYDDDDEGEEDGDEEDGDEEEELEDDWEEVEDEGEEEEEDYLDESWEDADDWEEEDEEDEYE